MCIRDRPQPTRGAPLTDFRRIELLLAGFFDAPELGGAEANAGPSADPATLAGARLAEDRGWRAPPMPERGPERPTEATSATELPGGPS